MINIREYFSERLRSRAFVAVIITYIILLLSSAVYWAIDGGIRNLLMSLGFILFAPMIMLLEWLVGFRCGAVFLASALSISLGSILGSCFDVYNYIPFFDTLLHGMSGVLFAAFGYTLAERMFGAEKSTSGKIGKIAFAVCFSLAIAVVWELFEYACTVVFGFDMMEDSIITDINSYLLAGSHNESVILEDIAETVIVYGNGQTYVINGYLDIGLIDTLTDMIICTVGSVLFAIIFALSDKFFPSLNRSMIPRLKASSKADGAVDRDEDLTRSF